MAKNPLANAGDMSSVPESGRSPGEGHGNTLQYSCLQTSMDRRAWWAPVHGVARVGHGLTSKQQQCTLPPSLCIYHFILTRMQLTAEVLFPFI